MKFAYPHSIKVIKKHPRNMQKGSVHLKQINHFKYKVHILASVSDLRYVNNTLKEQAWLRQSKGRDITRKELGESFVRGIDDKELKRRTKRWTYR